MPTIQTWWDTTFSSIANLWSAIWGFALPIIGALVILYIGWFFGKLAERILRLAGANLAQTDVQIAQSKFGQFLTSMGTGFSIATTLVWAAWAVKWFLYASFFMAAMSVLAFTSVNTFIGSAAAFFPNAAIGALFIFVGVLLARFLQSLLVTFLNAFRMPGSDITGTFAYWIVLIFAFVAALNHFGISFDATMERLPDMLVIAGGIAIGLGFSGKFADVFERIKKGL